jgi:hypothetical protein
MITSRNVLSAPRLLPPHYSVNAGCCGLVALPACFHPASAMMRTVYDMAYAEAARQAAQRRFASAQRHSNN